MVGEANSAEKLHIPVDMQKLPDEWHWARLEAVCGGIFDCPHSTPELVQDGPLLVRSQDMRSGVFRVDQAARVSEKTYAQRVIRAEPRHGDLFYSREGTYFGIAAEVPANTRVCLGQRMVLLRPVPGSALTRYLLYWLNSPALAAYVWGFRDGTVAERLNLPTIRGLPIAVPPLGEQRAIARILGSLDDKIALNRRMNRTLEQLAAAIFKSWFVDFDPVVARAEGRQPFGMDAETAALFPAAFEESEVGAVPVGWRVGKIRDLCELAYGKSLTAATRRSGNVPVFGSAGQVGWHDVALVHGPGIIVGRKGNVGQVNWTQDDFYPIDTTFYVVQRDDDGVWLDYTFHALALLDLANYAGDSAVPGLNRESTYLLDVLIPSDQIVRAFHRISRPLRLLYALNEQESRTLAAIRDALLPKLMSGEIRVG